MFDGPGRRPDCDECNGQGMLTGYGAFPGGDPRNFSPDEEMNTPEEMANHKAACESYAAPLPASHSMTPLEGGGFIHVEHTMFGIGVYTIPCFYCQGSGEVAPESVCVVCGTSAEEGCLCALGGVTP